MNEQVITHKCKNCGGDLLFEPESAKLVCSSCSQSYEINEIEDEDFKDFEEKEPIINTSEFEESEINEFHCANCGAVLITDKYTTSTICNFCNSPMIINERFTNKEAPTLVIPFKYNNEDAKLRFKKWCRGGFLTPKDFNYKKKVSSLEGIYIPFWLYNLECLADVDAYCTKIRSYYTGNYSVTETYHYLVKRRVEAEFIKIPADASIKMDDNTMYLLEPFDYSALEKFNTMYLSGFSSEQINYKQEELLDRVKLRANQFIMDYTKTTLNNYSTVSVKSASSYIHPKEANYVLLPIYIVNHTYKGKEYTFTMNGQTGKVIGKPPISIPKLILLFLVIFLIIILIGELFIWVVL